MTFILIISGCGKAGAPIDSYAAGSGSSSYDMSQGNDPHDPFMDSPGSGSIPNAVTLSWACPSHNEDGSPLADDLAGYIVYYGQGSGNYTESVEIGDFTSSSISNLSSGTWCFAVTAYDTAGNESDYSEEICKTIS